MALLQSRCFGKDRVPVTLYKFSAVSFIVQFATQSLSVTIDLEELESSPVLFYRLDQDS